MTDEDIEFWVSQDDSEPGPEICSLSRGAGMVLDFRGYMEYREYMVKNGGPMRMGVPWDKDVDGGSIFIITKSASTRSSVAVRFTRAQVATLVEMLEKGAVK